MLNSNSLMFNRLPGTCYFGVAKRDKEYYRLWICLFSIVLMSV